MRRSLLAVMALMAVGAAPIAAAEVRVSLKGSLAAMERQHGVALEHGYRFVHTPADLMVLEERGALVRLEGSEDYGFREGVQSLLARPEMRTFIERVSADYRAACDEQLIVTSLTRLTTRQPRNAHRLSVHPAGIAVDLRVSRRASCRAWLEGTLLEMEEDGLLDVTREHWPPHYHVALFPEAYMEHMTPILARERERAEQAERARAALLAAGPPPSLVAAPPAEDGPRWGLLAMVPVVAAVGVVVFSGRRTSRQF